MFHASKQLLRPVVAVLLALTFSVTTVGGTLVAQDATPADEFVAPEGLALEGLGFGTTEELPAAPAEFQLVRAVIDPEAGFPRREDIVSLIYVESGTLTIQMEAPLQVTRAGALEEGADLGLEEIAAGTEVTLEAGDSVVIPPNVAGEIRNDGDEPAVYLVAFVAPSLEE